MTKNVVIFMLSPFGAREYTFTDATKKFTITSNKTNETAVAYLSWKLEQKGEHLDKLFIFLFQKKTPSGMKNTKSDYEVFCELARQKYGMEAEDVPLNGGELFSMMQGIPDMYDKLDAYRRTCGGELRVHIDVTGGFRHASMMMLPLVRLLHYSGIAVGDILYSNAITGRIEDASELHDVFTLIGGAEEFITFGSIEQILKYFPTDDRPLRLNLLLEKMKSFSDTALICGNYQNMESALIDLSHAIDLYESSLKKDKPQGRELLFTRLLPRIKQEYLPVLPIGDKMPSAIEIIEWCVGRRLLPQAVIFFTEWLPHYIVESGKLHIKDKEIRLDCQKGGRLWQQWETYFFLNYEFLENPSKNVASLRNVAQTGDMEKLTELAKTVNPSLHRFLEDTDNWLKSTNTSHFAEEIDRLPEKDFLRTILKLSIATNNSDTLCEYLRKRVIREGDPRRVIVKALASVSQIDMDKLFGENQGEETTSEENKIIKDKIEWRCNAFRTMLEKKKISVDIPHGKFIEFIGKYVFCVNEWRNKIGHASGAYIHTETEQSVADTILYSLKLLNP